MYVSQYPRRVFSHRFPSFPLGAFSALPAFGKTVLISASAVRRGTKCQNSHGRCFAASSCSSSIHPFITLPNTITTTQTKSHNASVRASFFASGKISIMLSAAISNMRFQNTPRAPIPMIYPPISLTPIFLHILRQKSRVTNDMMQMRQA